MPQDAEPTLDPEIHARDEAFWRRQEQRRERGMGQPCCTQSGVSWSMIDVPGDFAVVVHGEFDCVNCFHHHVGRSARRFFSTRLSEAQLTRGDTQAPLRRLLELIVEEERPPMVLVLGTCPVEVIGDPFQDLVREVSARTGVPMVPLRTSGLRLTSQREMLDWLYTTLAQAAPLSPGPSSEPASAEPSSSMPAALNLFGFPSPRLGRSEPAAALARAGVKVGACLPQGATWADWQQVRAARRTALIDRSMFPRLVATLEEAGQELVEVQLPIGLGPTRRMYEALDRAAEAEGAVLAGIADELARAEEATAATCALLAGRRVGVALRMLNAYRVEALVHEGLGEVSALLELGLDVELLVQGPPDADARAAFADSLAARGVGGLPFRIFPAPQALPALLAQGRYDLVSLADSSRHAAHEAGVPYLPTGALQPYLAGIDDNLRLLRRLLTEARP